MIAVDTNIVVRLLTRDDPAQFEASYNLFQTSEIFIPDSVILETEWFLRYAYDFSAEQICTALRKLFGLKNVHLSHPQRIARIIAWHVTGVDFADAFHLANSQQCDVLKTFDDRFVKRASELSDCLVEKP